ncbi:hypothetical protein [uncultured Dokdonia sp.]|nr:hypothetical protein [uncultured Dokdonia sp.]
MNSHRLTCIHKAPRYYAFFKLFSIAVLYAFAKAYKATFAF